MSEEHNMNRNQEPHQQWNPNWLLKLLYHIWMILFTAAKVVLGAGATVLMILLICGLVLAGMLGDYLEKDIIPNSQVDLDSYTLEQNSTVYYVDDEGEIQILQDVYTPTSRKYAHYDEIPKDLINATVAIEDKRFFEHQGVDWVTTIKACAGMFFGDSSAGGSTITQQLVKNETRRNSITVQRKVLEIFNAFYVEREYDKTEIMEKYLNRIYLGQGCSGVKTAAAAYFGKELETLSTAECAALISITNNPSIFDPYDEEEFEYNGKVLNGYERNRLRKENTLWSMREEGYLTEEEYQAAINEEIVLKRGIDFQDRIVDCENEECGYHGMVKTLTTEDDENYYCPKCGSLIPISKNVSRSVYSWFVDTLLEDVAHDLAKKDGVTEWNDDIREEYMARIQGGGYHIYSTFDTKAQEAVDRIYADLDEIPDTWSGQQLQSAIVLIDNRTGDIVAMAGGVGEKEYHDQFNRATDSTLQTGSSIKPLTVYAPAFELGAISPITVIKDRPFDYSNGVFPTNDDFRYAYSRTVLSGVVNSVNTVAVNVLDQIGLGYSFSFARDKFGLTDLVEDYVTEDGNPMSDVGYAPLALGAQTWGVTVRDMSSAFATFANNGVYRRGRTYTKVYDSNGNVVLDNTQETREILSSKALNYTNYCLVNAVGSGTGTEAYISGMEIGGKTGSTSDWKDRWFCGFSGYYTAAVWCGYDTPEPIRGANGNPAARLWRKVMEPLHEGKEYKSLYSTDGMSWATMCLDSGKIATEACELDVRSDVYSRTSSAMAYPEDINMGSCTKHVMVEYCTEGKAAASEYCKLFEKEKLAHLEKKSLVRMTQSEIDEILRMKGIGLNENFLRDDYVYLVDSAGNPQNWHGFNGDINKGIDSPFMVCPIHTKEAWEKYQKDKKEEEEKEEEANKPTKPVKPTNPTVPTAPEQGTETPVKPAH